MSLRDWNLVFPLPGKGLIPYLQGGFPFLANGFSSSPGNRKIVRNRKIAKSIVFTNAFQGFLETVRFPRGCSDAHQENTRKRYFTNAFQWFSKDLQDFHGNRKILHNRKIAKTLFYYCFSRF